MYIMGLEPFFYRLSWYVKIFAYLTLVIKIQHMYSHQVISKLHNEFKYSITSRYSTNLKSAFDV